ncbi:MAG: SMC-Scp complex subunit ScpB [Chloroflexi bacterium]|jgi:segregation and condensation protein B|nr:SMC-Scp complex subunit ScpB [Chloroflexota bacterium]
MWQRSAPPSGTGKDSALDQLQRTDLELEGLLEALLFVADGPVELERLASVLDEPLDRVVQALDAWLTRHQQGGLTIARSGNRVLLTTRPEAAPLIERFLGVEGSARLSTAAMETLAIIAYLQPVTRARIDAIRGVSSAGVIRTLLARELVQVVGVLEQAGRPELLGTTFAFLQYLGLTSLDELPMLPELEQALQQAPQGD